jgi:hypothetical protein
LCCSCEEEEEEEEEEELVHPTMSTSTEPMIAVNRVIRLISVEHLSLRLLPHHVLGLYIVRRSS